MRVLVLASIQPRAKNLNNSAEQGEGAHRDQKADFCVKEAEKSLYGGSIFLDHM
ncbi:hypothetical protein CRM22_001216, partial [Opisthorchis felineus]